MQYLNSIALGLLAFGCTAANGKVTAVAWVVFLLDYYKNKNSYAIKACLSESIVANSVKAMFIFIALFALSSVLSWSVLGFKETGHLLEKIAPFFLAVFLLYRRQNVIFPLSIGVTAGTFTVLASALYNMAQGHFYRPESILGNPNSLGGWSILILPFTVAVFADTTNKRSVKVLSGLSSLFLLASLVISVSRGAMVGLVIMTLAALAMYFWHSYKAVAVAMAAAVLLCVGAYNIYSFTHRGYDYERVLLVQSGTQMFLDHPILGVGCGNFAHFYREKYISPLAREPRLDTPHNFILHYLDTVGIVGTSGLIIMLMGQVYCIYKNTFVNGRVNWLIFASFLSFLGMFVHGMVDIICMNRFYMIIYGFLWSITCWSIMSKKTKVTRN